MAKMTQQEARELIAFYDERGWDWTSALAFTLCKRLFGKNFRIYTPVEGEYLIRGKYKTCADRRDKRNG